MTNTNTLRFKRDDFNVSCEKLAKYLLGKLLIRQLLANGTKLISRICETECYLGGEDKASHSYGGKWVFKNMQSYQNYLFPNDSDVHPEMNRCL